MAPDPTGPWQIARVLTNTSPATIVLEAPLDLALGPGYPADLRVIVGNTIYTACGSGWFQGTVALTAVSGGTPAISGAAMNGAGVRVMTSHPGQATLIAKGQVDVTTPDSCVLAGVHPFELHLIVTAFRPTGAAFTVPVACDSAGIKRAAAGTRMQDRDGLGDGTVFSGLTPMLRAVPLDAAGRPTPVVNAHPMAQVAVTIQGPPSSAGLPLDMSWTIGSLVFPDASGPVTFTPAVGAPFVVESVRAEQIERLDLQIQVAGAAGDPLNLTDGATYDRESWHRKTNRIEPRVMASYVGGEPLCSPPGYAWFSFESATATVCTTMPVDSGDNTGYSFDGHSIRQRGRFVTDGTCTLSVRAPRLFGGAGLDRTVTITARDVASLLLLGS